MALTALNLTDPKYAWVIRPVEVEEVCVGGSSCITRGGSYSGHQWRSQVTDDAQALHLVGGGGLGACSPSKFLHLRGSYSDCS